MQSPGRPLFDGAFLPIPSVRLTATTSSPRRLAGKLLTRATPSGEHGEILPAHDSSYARGLKKIRVCYHRMPSRVTT